MSSITPTSAGDVKIVKRQFSLRALFIFSVTVGCWFGLFRAMPHVAIFVSGFLVAGFSTFLTITSFKHSPRITQICLAFFALLAWSYLYVVSIGPVIALEGSVLGLGNDLFEFIYRPVIWLHDATPLEKPLERYAQGWQ